MAAKRAKKGNSVKPPENENISKVVKALEKVQTNGRWQNSKLKRKTTEESGRGEKNSVTVTEEEDLEVPYVDVLPLPNIEKRTDQKQVEGSSDLPGLVGPGYKNKAPLQFDERA